MTVKTDSFKLSPAERLARKRAAARLRQQRCRARKRQASVSEKSGGETERRHPSVTHDQLGPVTTSTSIQAVPTPRLHPHRVHEHRATITEQRLPRPSQPASLPALPNQSSLPIFNCISFDSQRSYEEAQRRSPPRPLVEPSSSLITPSSSPPRKPSVVSLSDEKAEEPLVPEEEAAVVAMLSLKTGSEKKENRPCEREKPPTSPPRVVRVPHHLEHSPTSSTKYRIYHHQPQHHRILEPRRYDVYQEYGPPPPRPPRRTVPTYYRMPGPPMSLPPHYSQGGFYPPPSRYVRFNYE